MVQHTLIANACGTGLVGINAGDDDNFVRYLVLYLAQAVNVFQNGILTVGRAGANDQNQLVAFTGKYGANGFIVLLLLDDSFL